MPQDILTGLNSAQYTAVTTIYGPVLVLAGPGSGKTRVLAHRVAHLLKTTGVSPRAVMAVTFTNKAAGEMRERINRLVGEQIPTSTGWRGLTIGTFHSLCCYLLRTEGPVMGLNPKFVIFDDGDTGTSIRQAIKDLRLDDKLYRPEGMKAAISKAKSELITPENYPTDSYYEEVARRVYVRYEEILKANSALDFDDLLCQTVYLLRDHPEARQRLEVRYQFLMVDEFQDTNTAQYAIVSQLAQKHQNIFAVGDEDQSIFRFRGADYRNVRRFREDFPNARLVLLEQNYRSTQTILDVANAVISKNSHRVDKSLRTERGRGSPVVVHEAYDQADEASFIATTIQNLVKDRVAKHRDCAVMYRTNAQSRSIEDAFVARGIPYQLVGGTRFYQRKEVKDALGYLRLVLNPDDNLSLSRVINVPPRSIGDKTLAGLLSWSQELGISMVQGIALLAGDPELVARFPKPPASPIASAGAKALFAFYKMLARWLKVRDSLTVSDLLDKIAEESGLSTYLRDGTEEGEDRWNNVQELRSVAANYDQLPSDTRLTSFLEEVALVSDLDSLEEEKDRVTLLTLHTAKGLEFGVVLIAGLEENVLPHNRSLEDADEMEEERRLMYVGVTRARDRLYLIHAFRRTLYGRSEINAPSRFLLDIPPELYGGKAGGARRLGNLEAARSANTSWPRRNREEQDETWPRHRPAAGSPRTGQSPSGAARPLAAARPAQTAARPAPATQYKPGDRVDHGLFGAGIVLKVNVVADDEEVTVSFPGKGTKTLLASFAHLRKL
jgi:DNA helicase II / ATP-dependent DNA helicase PcrA